MSITTGGRFTVRDLDLVVDEVDIGGACGTIKLVRPKSEDDVLDMYVEIGREDADPYWAALWPSSVALARGVAGVVLDGREGMDGTEQAAMDGGDRHDSSLAGLSVCDMGAGLGLAGLAAAKRGAKSVSFYDREPLALQCCLLSAEANGLTVAVGHAGTVSDGTMPTRTHGTRGTVCVAEVFDWNAVSADQRTFDLVLACDVLYEAHAVAPVAALIPKLTNGGAEARAVDAGGSARSRSEESGGVSGESQTRPRDGARPREAGDGDACRVHGRRAGAGPQVAMSSD